MIRDIHYNSIVRISVVSATTETHRGTGFVISKSPPRVITSLHVVGDREQSLKEGTPKFYPGQVFVTFGGYQTPAMHRTQAQCSANDCDAELDWAVLNLESLPTSPSPQILPVGSIPEQDFLVPWMSFGFPEANPKNGMTVAGQVRAVGATYRGQNGHIQLFCEQAAAGMGMQIEGQSGGPCIVNGVVVGIMRAALGVPMGGSPLRVEAGTLYALQLSVIQAQHPSLFPHWPPQKQPYEKDVTELLRGATELSLRKLASHLEIPEAFFSRDVLAPRIASALLHRGFDAVFKALAHLADGLQRAALLKIVNFASARLVNEAAAVMWGQDIAQSKHPPCQPSAVAINGSCPETAQFYLLRACADLTMPTWLQAKTNLIPLTNTTGERVAHELIKELCKELGRTRPQHFGALKTPEDFAAKMAKLDCLTGPYFAVFFYEEPREEVLDELRRTFPCLHICLLVGVTQTDDAVLPVVRLLCPTLDPGLEEEMLQKYADAKEQIGLLFGAQP